MTILRLTSVMCAYMPMCVIPFMGKGNIQQFTRHTQEPTSTVSASQAEGREFKSRFPLQQIERLTRKNLVSRFLFCDFFATHGRRNIFSAPFFKLLPHTSIHIKKALPSNAFCIPGKSFSYSRPPPLPASGETPFGCRCGVVVIA